MRSKLTGWILRAPSLAVLAVIAISSNFPAPSRARATEEALVPLTLDAALREARQANAELPLAQFELTAAEAQAKQARGRFFPTLSLEGDLHDGAPQRYASGDALLAVFARVPLYAGGELRAERARSEAMVEAQGAGYKMAVREVDYKVRVSFDRVVRARSSLEFRRHAVARLNAYLSLVQARLASGQGVGADVLLAKQRLATARADTATVTRDLDEALLTLNDLLGRDPTAPLTLASLPDPAPPQDPDGQPWLAAPDLQRANAEVQAAQSDLNATRAGRRPHIDLEANAGVEPVLGTLDAPLNTGRDWGSEDHSMVPPAALGPRGSRGPNAGGQLPRSCRRSSGRRSPDAPQTWLGPAPLPI